MGHGLLDKVVNPGGVGGFSGAALGQFELQPLGHEREPGKLLAEIVVQIQTDAPPLLLRDFEQLKFEAPAFGILCPALPDLDDFEVAQTERASRRFGALKIVRSELAFGSLLEAADGGNDKAHGAAGERFMRAGTHDRPDFGPVTTSFPRRERTSSRAAPAG